MSEEKNTGNRTEVDPPEQEVQTPKFQHLAAALHAGDARVGNEEMVTVIVPKAFSITLSDGSRQRVSFTPGTYDIPARLTKHYYLKDMGVIVARATKAEETKVADVAPDFSKITMEDLNGMKFDQLGALGAQCGVEIEPLKSKEARRDAIAAKLGLSQ